jgi:hypothetical protein
MIENEARGAKREYPGTGMAVVKIPVENALAPDRTNWLDVDSDEARLSALLTPGSLPRRSRREVWPRSTLSTVLPYRRPGEMFNR